MTVRDWVPQRRAVAYHEAGHAVVAAAHGYNVYQINTDGVANGDVWFCSPISEEGAPDGRCRLLSVDVAGRLAQSIAFGEERRDIVTEFVNEVRCIRQDGLLDMDREHARAAGLELDDYDVAMHLRGRSDEEMRAQLTAAHDVARSILEDQWGDIDGIAACIGGADTPTG